VSSAFPFGFPGPTALYLTLYVATLAIHVAFMSYVLAGSFYLAIAAISARGRPRAGLGAVLCDWLPFALGLAITAGVAPLLFLQILYEHRFYTANLLLFHRWMTIVPALIVGFYLLYVLKSDVAKARPWAWRAAAVGAFVAFGFVAWSWTENHLLSRDQGAWVTTYASSHLVYRMPETLPRLSMWFFGSAAIMAAIAGWQVRGADMPQGERRRVALVGIAALAAGGVAAAWYAAVSSVDAAAAITSSLALPYSVVTGLGAVLMLAGWLRQLRAGEGELAGLVLTSAGAVFALFGSGVMRESIRLHAIDLTPLYPQHAGAASAGGGWLFALFLVVNGALIAFAIRIGAAAANGNAGEG
jgi:hypothetical protein